MDIKRKTLLWFSATAIAIFSILIYALKGRLFPIVGAVVLVYLTKPIQRALKSLGLSPKSSAMLISLSLFGVICFIALYGLPIIATELTRIIRQLPENIETTYNLFNQLLAPYDLSLDSTDLPKIITQTLSSKDLSALQDLPSLLSSTIRRFIDIILFFTSILFIPLFFFFALQHGDNIQEAILSTVPQIIRQDVADFIALIHETLSTWIAGQGGVIICLCILYTLGFYLFSIPYPSTLGIITGLLYIIPAAGPFIALSFVSTIAIATNGLDAVIIMQILGLFGVLQTLESLVLSPLLIGSHLGLSLPILLFSILIGGGLLGGAGIILSVPIASLTLKTVHMIRQKQASDWLYD